MPTEPAPTQGALTMEVRAAGPSSRAGGTWPLAVVFRNGSRAPVLVHSTGPALIRLRSPEPGFSLRAEFPPPPADMTSPTISLEPGQELTLPLDLLDLLARDIPPGGYRVVIVWRHGTGFVRSEPVHLTLEP